MSSRGRGPRELANAANSLNLSFEPLGSDKCLLAAAAAAATTAAVALVIFAVFVSCCAFRFDDEAPAVSALYGCSATLNGMAPPPEGAEGGRTPEVEVVTVNGNAGGL